MEMRVFKPSLKKLRRTTIILGTSNMVVVLLGVLIVILARSSCDFQYLVPFVAVSLGSGFRLVVMVQCGLAQYATAQTILDSPSSAIVDRRRRYKTWIRWSRFALVITVLQFMGAIYLVFHVAKHKSQFDDGKFKDCVLGMISNSSSWGQKLLVFFMIMVCFVGLVQCFTGPDILKWRSFYATQDNAWKAHYREVFDNGMREALCCLGRVKYLSMSEEDEIYSVARLLGDLVAYRASGTGHLELLAGLALLQRHSHSLKSLDDVVEAPEERLKEAAALHKFAVAAYTGPLLDIGRNPLFFPCAWLYRQGILTPWTRNRRPKIDGDNWWRGHAAAFLKYVNLSPEVLRHGRVNQAKCEAAYFIVVLHHLRSVVIAIRGTETAEDLITDGLCKECALSADDLDGLMNSSDIDPVVKCSVDSSFPHYGHSGIVEAAQDLFMQIDGTAFDHESSGYLSSLLGARCECDGYNVRIVGHSLGGSIGALLGIKLYSRYPNLHVYAYGPLPCVDSVIANACSDFVTSTVCNNEFSAHLSIGSILRLRAAAITALSQDNKTDTTMVFQLARRFLYVSNYQRNRTEVKDPASDFYSGAITAEDFNHHINGSQIQNQNDSPVSEGQHQGFSLWNEADNNDSIIEIDDGEFTNPIATTVNTCDDPISQFMETIPRSENGSAGDPPELYLPGLIIHMVPQQRSSHTSLWKCCTVLEKAQSYKAYIANRESFKDIIVSPSMFLDHLPWRCHYAMQKVLEAQGAQAV